MKRSPPVLCAPGQTSEVGRQVRVPISVDYPLAKYGMYYLPSGASHDSDLDAQNGVLSC
jgi:hypothetical protein